MTLTCAVCAAPVDGGRPICDRPRCEWLFAQIAPARLCAACGRPDCGPVCRHPEAARRRAEEADRRAQRQRQFEAVRDAERPDGDRFPLLIVPAFRAESRPVTTDRRAALAGRVQEAFAQARADGVDPPPPAPPSLAVAPAACAACGGDCCRTGRDHAYLNAGTAALVMRDHPERTPQEWLTAYLTAIPAEALEGSCVYHTAGGCALPPGLRSDTCHVYHCDALRSFRGERAFVASDDGQRTAFVDGAR